MTFRSYFARLTFFALLGGVQIAGAQEIPSVLARMSIDDGVLAIKPGERIIEELEVKTHYGLKQMIGDPKGTDEGITFDFGPDFMGKLYYGFIPYGDSKHPMPVYFRSFGVIENGTVEINIKKSLSGTYDMIDWEDRGFGSLGYRVVDSSGQIIYDGIVSFKGTGPFAIDHTVIEGPFVNAVHEHGATISFTTNVPCITTLQCGPLKVEESAEVEVHEIYLNGLEPDSLYAYTLTCGMRDLTFSFRTAPTPGTRKPFVFAYASDSRTGQGGGERSFYGANAYIMKKIMALAVQKKIAFMQFSGDLINGYLANVDDMNLQYANWKRAVQPFLHYFPTYVSMGNHEALVRLFIDEETGDPYMVDRFPYDTESSEKIFADNFVNPKNGPASEDGAEYDPDPDKIDFPSYDENVFYYTHDNVAVIVLNSDYLYTPTTNAIKRIGGGLHGYIMDQQLAWLEATVAKLEADENIDHVFLTQHTPCFPNGGHVRDDMWYGGNNDMRPWIGGRALRNGIIQRRDQILDIIINKSSKVRAILTGDEHNYNRLKITSETTIYPEVYFVPKIEVSRTIYQINNGAAGAPYYAQEQTPWTPFVSGFTTQNALVFFNVEGNSIWVEVLNPDTLEEVDQFWLTEDR